MTTAQASADASASANRTGLYLAVLQLVFTLGWTTYVIYLPKLAAEVGIAPTAVIFILMLEIMARPPLWVHLAVGLPVVILTTVLPLRPIKGWLIAAQFTTRAQEAGTADLWAKLHGDRRA